MCTPGFAISTNGGGLRKSARGLKRRFQRGKVEFRNESWKLAAMLERVSTFARGFTWQTGLGKETSGNDQKNHSAWFERLERGQGSVTLMKLKEQKIAMIDGKKRTLGQTRS